MLTGANKPMLNVVRTDILPVGICPIGTQILFFHLGEEFIKPL
jgi:hypothetical protein